MPLLEKPAASLEVLKTLLTSEELATNLEYPTTSLWFDLAKMNHGTLETPHLRLYLYYTEGIQIRNNQKKRCIWRGLALVHTWSFSLSSRWIIGQRYFLLAKVCDKTQRIFWTRKTHIGLPLEPPEGSR